MSAEWCMAAAWRSASVTLDGSDVLRRCRGVLMDGERPVAVDLYEMDEAGYHIIRGGEAVTRVVYGAIAVSGLRPR